MRGESRRRIGLSGGLLAAAAAVVAFPGAGWANVGRPDRPGDAAGEPRVAPALPAIEREALLLDLRPLAAGEPARIAASYRFHAAEALSDLRLVFASPGVAAGAVRLDGAPLPSAAVDPSRLPAEWRAPMDLPGIEGDPVRFRAEASRLGALEFAATLAPGPHVLTVEARVRPGEHHGSRSPNRDYLLAYLLAPARQWGGFGELELTVELPPGWLHAASPALDRLGDRLVGRWPGLPADGIGVVVRPPGEATIVTTGAPWAGAGLGAVLAWLAGRGLGRRSARRNVRTGKRWWKAVGLAYLASALVVATTAAAAVGGSALLADRHRSAAWATAYRFESVFAGAAGLVAALAGFFAAFVLAHRAASRAAGAVAAEARREGGS